MAHECPGCKNHFQKDQCCADCGRCRSCCKCSKEVRIPQERLAEGAPEIARLLLKRRCRHGHDKLVCLDQEMGEMHGAKADALRHFIHKELDETDKVGGSLNRSGNITEAFRQAYFRDAVKRLERGSHHAWRNWQKIRKDGQRKSGYARLYSG